MQGGTGKASRATGLERRHTHTCEKMPSYELNLIVKRLPRASLVECLQRISEQMLDSGCTLRKIEFLGHRRTPYSLPNVHLPKTPRIKEGSYFLFHIDMPAMIKGSLAKDLRLDYDLLKVKVLEKWSPKLDPEYKCTLHEEMLPPPERPSVQDLIKVGKRPRPEPIVGAGTHVDD